MSRVQLENVTKIYQGNVVAVKDFSLDIKDKEFIVFVGPSGCGKSTTLRMIAGLEDISSGTLKIDGKVVNDLQPKDRDISMVFQNYALYPHLTVYENMAFPLRISKVKVEKPKQEKEIAALKEKISLLENDIQRYEEALNDVDLVNLSNKEALNKTSKLKDKLLKNTKKIEALQSTKEPKELIDEYNLKALDFEKKVNELRNIIYASNEDDDKNTLRKYKSELKKAEKNFNYYLNKAKNPLSASKVERINDSLAMISYQNVILQEQINDINNKYIIERQLNCLKKKKEELEKELSEPSFRYERMSEKEIYSRITNVANILGITKFLDRKPRALSGGQRQRVAIGRAMVKDCKVFLMDEPLSNLDAKLRNQMRSEIILLRKKIDTTFIYVTHDQTEAMTLGDKIVIMKDGLIMQVGSPEEVFDHPENLFVAEFIGAPKMNIIESNISLDNQDYIVDVLGCKIKLSQEKAELLKKNKVKNGNVLLGIRPEHIRLATENDDSHIDVTLEVNEMMGSEYHLHVVSNDKDKIIVRVPTISLKTEERNKMVAGAKLSIAFDEKVIQLFDKETEKSLLR